MKLILTAEVDHLGVAGDTVEVKDGYGRNYLLPARAGDRGHPGAERQADEIRRARELKTVKGLEHANELKTALEGLGTVDLPVEDRSDDSGKLFGSVTAADVVGGDQEGRRTQPRQADRAAAQGAHQGRRHPSGRGAAASRRGRRGVAERRRPVLAAPASIIDGEEPFGLRLGRCCHSGEHFWRKTLQRT